MPVQQIHVAGTGVYLPDRVMTAEEAVRLGRYTEQQRAEHEQISVRVADDMSAPDMAVEAGRRALERSGHEAADIGLLIHVNVFHQGPDGWSPPHYIQRHVLGTDVPALEIRQGCNGMLTAVDMAAAYLRSKPCEAVLITSADNFSAPLVDRWQAHPGCVLGDGAAAVVLSKRPGVAELLALGQAALPDLEEMRRSGIPLFPPGATVGTVMDFKVPTAHYRTTGASLMEVGTRINDALSGVLKQTLADAALELSDITAVTHMNMAPQRVDERMLAPLGIDGSKSTTGFGRTVGHLGASDQFVGLDHLMSAGRLSSGNHVLMVGVGPGVDLSCAILRMR
ncbi:MULTISPECIES: ketoacyl-ACP synthase III family protein [Streptomyces]|uniref:ketoacyl-ACP synthase III family protein n=1 Tax=Streptomyces TaxID=1883 RepID=UPI00207A9749|nr:MULTISPECIES: ketoacyl-ACP synthase III family protein [Streptomyces]MCM9082450.1 ketoacyl-ACP synthase III family protein [Streptomyces spororaveus]MCX5302975.1 ketoacyl-ACP synthase III family protein [Streptomyces sp. NBC_00160]